MTKTLKMNQEPKFEISVVCFFFFEKYITKYTAHFAPEQNLAIFFSLTAHQNKSSAPRHWLERKKNNFRRKAEK